MNRLAKPVLAATIGCSALVLTQVSLLQVKARPSIAKTLAIRQPLQGGLHVDIYRHGEQPPPRPDFVFDPRTMGRTSIGLVPPPGQEQKAVVQMPKLADGRLNVVAQPDIHVAGLAIFPGYYRFVVEFIQVENCCGQGEQKETKLARYEFDPFRVNQGEAYTAPVELPVPHPGPACNINVQLESAGYETDADIGGIPTHWDRAANQQVSIRADG